MKEETFTDMIILELKRKHPLRLATHAFTRHQESVSGADWEWWFHVNGTKWLGFRIQAKIINNHSDSFLHLHHRTPGTTTYQCDKLIRNSIVATFPKIPLYVLYINADNTYFSTWKCGTFPPTRSLWGCSLLSAFQVRRLRMSNQNSLKDVENLLRPWHCLVCCNGFGDDQIENMDSYIKRNFRIVSDDVKGIDIDLPESFVLDSPPDYVLQTLKNEFNDNIKPPDEDLGGIIVINVAEQNLEG